MCSATASATVNNAGAPTVTATSTDLLCNGDANGTAAVTATGGVTPYTYLWNTGATTSSLSGLSGGVYSCDVTDASGCVASAVVTVTEPSAISLSTAVTDATCGASDGTASVSASGGTSPYTYLWSNGQTSSTATGLAPGSYTVTVTDANNCTATATVGVSNVGAPSTTSTATNASCVGDSD